MLVIVHPFVFKVQMLQRQFLYKINLNKNKTPALLAGVLLNTSVITTRPFRFDL